MRALAGILAVLCMIALWVVGLGIYLFCLYLAYLTSFIAILLTFFFPFVGQLYWIWTVWMTTGVFLNPLTIACLVWIGLAAVGTILFATAER